MTYPLFEEWRDIRGYEDSYQISNLGNFRSKTRKITNAKGIERTFKSRILAQGITPSGYLKVNLSRDGKAETRYTHRVVLESFVGACPDGMEVDHIDNDKSNNALTNLRYLSHAENMERQNEFGTSVRAQAERGEHYKQKSKTCVNGHLFEGENLSISRSEGKRHRGCRSCAYAHSIVHQNPKLESRFKEIADKKYNRIMECYERN